MTHPPPRPNPPLPCEAALIVAAVLREDRRVLLFGPPGIGKSTLAARLADALLARGRACQCLGADPGSPAFGLPGALTLAARRAGGWASLAVEPLCTLDAGRFRLPLVSAVRRLLARADNCTLLLDGPGVVRGVAGRELLQGLFEAVGPDLILAMTDPGRPPPLGDELTGLAAERWEVEAAAAARRPGKRTRARTRTAQWDGYLAGGVTQHIDMARCSVLGTPPPLDEPAPWVGRQVALLAAGELRAMGEVLRGDDTTLTLRLPHVVVGFDSLLVRDAARGAEGLLESAPPFAAEPWRFAPPAELLPEAVSWGGPRPTGRVGALDVALVNGVFGDPLLHVRFRQEARSFLFDLGEGSRLSARVAHQVSDVFVSHAHMDHLGGFLWLLRSRIGGLPPCRLYGPPALAQHVSALIAGFLWDRVGEAGPAFEITELHGDVLRRYGTRAGRPGLVDLGSESASGGVVLSEPGFRVRAVTLDHHTPVLAYALEPERELRVRKDRLRSSGLQPGPWLTELKRRLRAGDEAARLALPNGTVSSVADLGRDLVLIEPPKRLVYATDLADTPANRERLVALARNAHTLFLEATFAEADRALAERHGHLTARACGEIASAAGVSRLVPFHLSRRYVDDSETLFEEVRSACACAVLPREPLRQPAASRLAPDEALFL